MEIIVHLYIIIFRKVWVMKLYKYIDCILICVTSVFLCLCVSIRIITKEVLIDRLQLSVPGANYILYDLNTTVEMPENIDEMSDKNIGERLEGLIHKYQSKLTAYTTSAMPFNQRINDMVVGWNGKFVNIPTTYSSVRYISEPFENVIDFSSFLQSLNVPFMYISAPCYDTVLCRKGEKEIFDNRLCECNWYMLENLKSAHIDTIDLAQEIANVDMVNYDVTNHWFPECALYSAGVIAERVNQYGFEFRVSDFDCNATWDYLYDKKDLTKIIYDTCGYEYSLPIPDCTEGMQFTLEYSGSFRQGTFDEVFLQIPSDNDFVALPYHGFSAVGNIALFNYHNLSTQENKGKRMLIIGDSFNWILSGYLASGIEYVDVIHNASYTSSIREYIKETKPDMVLIIYSDAEFSEVYTEQAYLFE